MSCRLPLCLSALLMLAGCAGQVPLEIRVPPDPDLSLREVLAEPRAHEGARVRWGGVIAGVENREKETWLEVSARPLDSSGRPFDSDQSAGRFLVRQPGFLDPTVYREDRRVTVRGVVEGVVVRRIGQHPYAYPLLRAQALYLWPELPPPWAWPRDPWFDPWLYHGYYGSIPYHYRWYRYPP